MMVSGHLHASAALPQQKKKSILVSDIGECVGNTAGLDALEKREISFQWGRATILRSSVS